MSFVILDTWNIELLQDKSAKISKGCDLFIDFSKISTFTYSTCLYDGCGRYGRLNIDNQSYFVKGTELLKYVDFI